MGAIDYFFKPRSVAVIGASRERGKIGNAIFENFVSGKFRGKVYPVNPKAKQVLGVKCYKSVKDIPTGVDLAVIVVPSLVVKKVMQDCAEKRVKACVIITSGFSEVGNKKLEDEIALIAKNAGMRVIGPNCLGVFDAFTNVDTLFLPVKKLGRPKRGTISFISQSGAVGSIVLDWMASKGYGVSKFVSYGNAVDVNETKMIAYLAHDKTTRVICAYLEGVKDGRLFMRVAERAVKKKPIIVLKGGRTKAGSKAVSSHTGSLAGSDAVYDAAFRQCGVIRAKDLTEMFTFARVLSEQPLPKGNRIAVVTNGGGFGVLAADETIFKSLRLAELSERSRRVLSKVIPSYGGIHNPVDLVGDAGDDRYKRALDVLEKDDNVDAVLCILLFQTATITPSVIDHVVRFAKRRKKPIVVCSAGGKYTGEMARRLEEHGIPVFDTPSLGIDALDALVDYSNIKRGREWTYE
ncbi:MAG: CoA-binding protein [archaeon]